MSLGHVVQVSLGIPRKLLLYVYVSLQVLTLSTSKKSVTPSGGIDGVIERRLRRRCMGRETCLLLA